MYFCCTASCGRRARLPDTAFSSLLDCDVDNQSPMQWKHTITFGAHQIMKPSSKLPHSEHRTYGSPTILVIAPCQAKNCVTGSNNLTGSVGLAAESCVGSFAL